MATKVKPCRIQATGTPQAWYVPKYVDEDTFQWWAWWWGWWSDIEYVTQAEYNALLPWALTDGKHYFIYSTSGGWGWQPWANTVAYYPLNSTYNFTDQSWNWYDLTVSDAVITTLNGISCASYTWGRAYNSSAPVGTQRTQSAWIYNPWSSWVIVGTWEDQESFYAIMLYLNSSRISVSDFHQWWAEWTIPTQNAWHHVLTTADNSALKVYMDWTLIASWTHDRTDSSTWISAWGKPFANAFPDVYTGYLSNVIVENVVRTDQEVADYYDLTKWDYWIS